MNVSEAALLKSGFSQADLQKLKNNIANYGGTLDSVTHDLANRFNASKWITATALTILVLTLIMASKSTSITLGITLAIVLPFIWYITPLRMGYKSWRYRKALITSEPNQKQR